MRHLQTLRYVDAVARAGSIRRAAETLAITSTALNRRILALEEELGAPIFERLPHGVRLSTAGELLIRHIRDQLSDIERVKSQIADLSGVRRGRALITPVRCSARCGSRSAAGTTAASGRGCSTTWPPSSWPRCEARECACACGCAAGPAVAGASAAMPRLRVQL